LGYIQAVGGSRTAMPLAVSMRARQPPQAVVRSGHGGTSGRMSRGAMYPPGHPEVIGQEPSPSGGVGLWLNRRAQTPQPPVTAPVATGGRPAASGVISSLTDFRAMAMVRSTVARSGPCTEALSGMHML